MTNEITKNLAKLFDRFKKDNPTIALILALIIGVSMFVLEYLVGAGYFEGQEWTVRVLQILGFLWTSVNGSRTYKYLNEDVNTLIPPLENEYEDVFKHVDEDKKSEYLSMLNAPTTLFNDSADIVIDTLETIKFSPDHVKLSNRNWAIDNFGSEKDYQEFNVRRKQDIKIFVGVFDDGVPTHEDLQKTNIGGMDFTGEGILSHHKHSHSTAVGSCFASTNKDVTPFYNLANNIEVFYFKVLKDSGRGSFEDIKGAIDEYINIVKQKQEKGYWCFANFSLGANAPTPADLNRYFKKLYDNNIIVNAANGNSGLNVISTPANSQYTDGYSAINVEQKIAGFSNHGVGTFLAHPGVMMYLCAPNNGYSFISGTSFSSPDGINPYIAALFLYDFSDKKSLQDYIISVSKDLGKIGYDILYGNGNPLLRVMLDNPPKDDSEPSEPPVEEIIPTKDVTMIFMDGWETMFKRKGGEYQVIFFDEIQIKVSSTKGIGEVEEIIRKILDKFFNDYKFSIPTKKDFLYAARVISAFLETEIRNNNFKVLVTEVVVDNNEDESVNFTIPGNTLNGFRGRGIFVENNTLFSKHRNVKRFLAERIKT